MPALIPLLSSYAWSGTGDRGEIRNCKANDPTALSAQNDQEHQSKYTSNSLQSSLSGPDYGDNSGIISAGT